MAFENEVRRPKRKTQPKNFLLSAPEHACENRLNLREQDDPGVYALGEAE